MTAAIALAVVLVIAVVGASMAMESQRSGQTGARPARPVRPARATDRERTRRPLRSKDRTRPAEPPDEDVPPPPVTVPEAEFKRPDVLRNGVETEAKVVSVVDERTIGPVTRSRLLLRIEPEQGPPLEVTVRHAFPTPEARANIKVGGAVPVRYDPDEPRRVVIDLPQG